MTNKTFIRISQVVTADQAALVAAGINIAEVDGNVSEAKKKNVNGWHMAETIRNALLDNLGANHLDPELVSIVYLWWNEEGFTDVKKISGLVNIIPCLQRYGAPHGASFKAATLWPWIAKQVDLDPEIYDVIASTYGLKHNSKTKTDSSVPGYLDPSHPRYSPKLAASVLAWEAMEDENLCRGVSPKSAITTWLTNNHKAIGLDLSKSGIGEVATVVNWKTTGGAPVTPD